MKSFFLALEAVLLGLAATVAAIPAPAPFDAAAVNQGSAVLTKDGKQLRTLRLSRELTSFSDLAAIANEDLKATFTIRIEEGTVQAEKCIPHDSPYGNECLPEFLPIKSHGNCWCAPIYKQDTDLVQRQESEDARLPFARLPFDPRVYCTTSMKDHCPAESVGLWSKSMGRCYCGHAELAEREEAKIPPGSWLEDLVFFAMRCQYDYGHNCAPPTFALWSFDNQRCYCASNMADYGVFKREAAENSSVTNGASIPKDPDAYCEALLKDRCAAGTCGYWDKEGGFCYCSAGPKTTPTTDATTAGELVKRLVFDPLAFPTYISDSGWTAILASLTLLRDFINSQSDLHNTCSGRGGLQVYGFEPEVFRKLCTPEIAAPVATSEVDKAETKVLSAMFVDNKYKSHKGDWTAACDEVKLPGGIPANSSLDTEWILQVLCKRRIKTY
jgi:hypothetical protein